MNTQKNSYIDLKDEELMRMLKEFYDYFDDGFTFEEFLKEYLEVIGIDEIEVTQRFRDGGIDLKGVRKGIDLLTDLDSINYYIQAKLYKPENTVSIKDVRALRGVMPNGYKGIFITTGRFSKKALEFGKTDNSRPIIFINGKKLIQSCIDNGIGFKSKPVFDPQILNHILEENKKIIQYKNAQRNNKLDIEDAINKQISVNDVRARILPIPKSIFKKIPQDYSTFEVEFENNDKKNLNINRDRKYFGGITAIYRKYGLLDKNDRITPKDSYWLFDNKKRLIKVFFENG